MNFTYIDIVIAYDNQDAVIQIITWNSKDILQFTKMAYLHKENNNCFNPPIFLFINIISTSQNFSKVFKGFEYFKRSGKYTKHVKCTYVTRTNFIEYPSPYEYSTNTTKRKKWTIWYEIKFEFGGISKIWSHKSLSINIPYSKTKVRKSPIRNWEHL